MAGDAGHRRSGIAAGGMARRARGRDMRTHQRETRLGVVERCGPPHARRMAERAVLRESCRQVIRSGRRVEGRSVASVARRGCSRELIAGMARRTLHRVVGAGQRKFRSTVVDCGALPLHRCVTGLAVLRERSGHVVRIGGGVERGEVTGNAGRTYSRKTSLCMARRARHGGVGACQRERSPGVIERRSHPGVSPLVDRVTTLAIGPESRRLMIDRL